MEIKVSNVSFIQDDQYILKDITCTILPRRVTCLMGISGSGKTAFMDTVVGRRHDGKYTGTISCQGATLKQANIAYCQNVDVHLAEFTVMQHLYYACRFRLGNKLSREDVEKQCHLAASFVGIESKCGSVVGVPGEEGGISDGERRLLSIAIELVGVPPVLCLDDPMSGLDATSATQVTNVLHTLAHQHEKTVLCTIRHPTSVIASFCDNVLLLSRGKVAYSGQYENFDKYLSRFDLPSRLSDMSCWSPADRALDFLSDHVIADTLISAWLETDEGKWLGNEREFEKMSSTATEYTSPNYPMLTDNSYKLRHPEYENTSFEQALIFLRRHAHYKLISNAGGVKTILGRFIIAGVLFGFTFKDVGQKVENLGPIFNYREGHLYAAVYNLMGLMFCYSVFVTVSNFLPLPMIFDMRRVYELEMINKLYHPFVRWLANILIDAPIIAVGTCCFIFASSSMIKPNGDLIHYYCLFSFASVIGFSYANICVEITRALRTAILLFGMCAALAIWFSGYSISTEDLMSWMKWGPKFSYLYWVTGSMMYEEFSFLPNKQRDFILGKYNYDDMPLHETYLNLTLMLVVTQAVLLCLVLRPLESTSRFQPVEYFEESPERISSTSTPLIEGSSFQLTSDEESFAIDFFGKRDSNSFVEMYESPPFREHILPEHHQSNLICENFSYCVFRGRIWNREEEYILNMINLSAFPGELCGVIGHVGSGKTTLLQAIAGVAVAGITEGSIMINGVDSRHDRGNVVDSPSTSYISSLDCHYSLLTVRETLEYAALLRFRTSSTKSVADAVDKTLRLLDLDKNSNCLIGADENLNITKGQLRRLTIGCGIVHNASLLLLDQPLCALDASACSTVIAMLRTLANTKRTILCSVHGLSQADFREFDKVILLNRGRVIYCGQSSECESFFRKLECYIPAVPVLNAVEFILEASSRLSLDDYDESREGSNSVVSTQGLAQDVARQISKQLQDEHMKQLGAAVPINRNIETKLGRSMHLAIVILRRDFCKEMRRWWYWVYHFCRCVALGLFLGTVFYDLDSDDAFGRMALFLQVYVVSSLWISELLPDMHIEKEIFEVEKMSKATNSFTFWLVVGAPVMVNLIVSSICFGVPIYYLSNLRSGCKFFSMFTLTIYVATLGNLYMAYAIVFFASSYRTSVTLYPGVVGMQTFYCGYSVIISSLAKWFRWGATVNPGTYAMAAMYQNELKNNGFEDYEEFADFFEWDHSLRSCLLYLLIFIIMHKLIFFLMLNLANLKRL